MYLKIIKPILDWIAASVLVFVLFPFLLVIIILLAIIQKGNVFFIQQRPGKHEKLFYLIKFKTMTDAKDDDGILLDDHKRVSKLGLWLRKTSVDELPQLINVLKGEMSLVGPRPLLPEYLVLYEYTQARRHLVRGGITGYAQIHGRNAISWNQKFGLDVWYVDNISFWLDLKILWFTCVNVVLNKDINSSDCLGMRKFDGNN